MAKFLKSASSEKDWFNDNVKEFCFIGRSNVGKSSTINALASENICRVSKTPGRTQLVNFFDFNTFRLVDLPGYGYAKVSQASQQSITKILDEYILKRKNIVGIFQILDINVITDLDIQVATWINSRFKNHIIILNKIDKVNNSFFANNKNKILDRLPFIEEENLLCSSAKNKNGVGSIYKKITDLIKKA